MGVNDLVLTRPFPDRNRTQVWVDEEENPFDKDWESFPPEELADHCGISDLFYWERYDEDPEASPKVDNPWASTGPERKVGVLCVSLYRCR